MADENNEPISPPEEKTPLTVTSSSYTTWSGDKSALPPGLMSSASAWREAQKPVAVEKVVRNVPGIELAPEMLELFDHLWVKVQRGLAGKEEDEGQIVADAFEIRHHSVQSIIVTSWGANDGSSTVAAGLASRAAATAQGKVCLVDADFQMPGLTGDCGAGNRDGLRQLLDGSKPLDELLVKLSDGHLWFLPCGRGADREALSQDSNIQRSLAELEDRFRYVIFDAGNLQNAVEPFRWGRFVINALLVVQAGRTRRQTVTHAVNTLKLHGMNIIGTILNRRVDHIPSWLYPYL